MSGSARHRPGVVLQYRVHEWGHMVALSIGLEQAFKGYSERECRNSRPFRYDSEDDPHPPPAAKIKGYSKFRGFLI